MVLQSCRACFFSKAVVLAWLLILQGACQEQESTSPVEEAAAATYASGMALRPWRTTAKANDVLPPSIDPVKDVSAWSCLFYACIRLVVIKPTIVWLLLEVL